MAIKIGDRVSYQGVYTPAGTIFKGGTGRVIELKADYFGKTSRTVAVVKNNYGESIEMYTSALKVVN